MTNPGNEKLINYLVVLDRPGRKFTSESDTRWGGLIEPASGENPDKTACGMKVVLFASWEGGYLVLETMKAFEMRFPDKLNLVGVITDDPLDPDAKISIKKRIWGFLDIPDRVIDETTLINSALSYGIPVYTGEVKTNSFHRLIQKWNPDAIMVCIFGQLLDNFIIGLPPYGIYNFHPSDLLHGHGAGPAPYEDLSARHVDTTVWSVHHVTEKIDSGHVVGQSPPIYVLNTAGVLPVHPFVVYNRFAEALSPLVVIMVNELYRNYESKKTGFISHIDFPVMFPEEVSKKLMNPISIDNPVNIILKPDLSLFI